MPNLSEHLSSAETTAQLSARFGYAAAMKSINNLLLLGDGETWNRQRIDFAGLPEMVRTFLQVAAGAADIPVTRLLGQSPAGLSATGESDTRNTYDMIAARQELELRPALERLDRVIAASEGIDPSARLRRPAPLAARRRHRPERRQVSRRTTPVLIPEASMPYTIPAPADLVTRFPAFTAVPQPTLAQAILEAQTRVDTTWTPADYTIGIMLLAAHTLTLDGIGTGAEAASAAAGTLGFQSMRSGGLGLDRPRPVRGAAEPSLLAETTYGRRFLALLKVNQPGVLVP